MSRTCDDIDDLIEFELGADGTSILTDGAGGDGDSGGDSNAGHDYDDQEFLIINDPGDDSIEGFEEHLLEDDAETITDDIVFTDHLTLIPPKLEPDSDDEDFILQEIVDVAPKLENSRSHCSSSSNSIAVKKSVPLVVKKEKKPILPIKLEGQRQTAPPRVVTQTVTTLTTATPLESSNKRKKLMMSKKSIHDHKGPLRYMLFDDLIATIVDFDVDDTPIVEFSMSASKTDETLPIECGICPEVMDRSNLAVHLKSHLVPESNRFACIYCDETYRDSKYLAGHARRHMGIRPYVCEECKLYFSTKQDLRVHNQRRHLEKEHICEVCGKTFAQSTQLKRHRESTHEKKRRFSCPYCNKAYYKNFSLQEHIRNVHMGKRRMLVCPFCGMQCRDAHKMARHRKEMHLTQSVFVCHVCREEFTDINYFDAHKRSIQCRSNTRRKLQEEEEEVKEEEEEEDEEEEEEGIHQNRNQLKLNINEEEDNEGIDMNVGEHILGNIGQSQFEEHMLVEQLVDDEDFAEEEDGTFIDMQDLNGDELIYEVTLEADDNN